MQTRQSTLAKSALVVGSFRVTNIWTSFVGVRAVGLVKRLAKMPPVLLRAASLVDCVLVMGGGDIGDLGVVVRRTDGLEDKSPL
jgi:hypothetical protein